MKIGVVDASQHEDMVCDFVAGLRAMVDTALNNCGWPWRCQPCYLAMALTIWMAVPKPFSDAWRTSPAAISLLVWDNWRRLGSRYF